MCFKAVDVVYPTSHVVMFMFIAHNLLEESRLGRDTFLYTPQIKFSQELLYFFYYKPFIFLL